MTTQTSTTASPLLQTPPPTDVPGAWFDQAAVDRVVRFFRSLRHTKGKWAGVQFDPLDWQVEYLLAPVFGWKNAEGYRIVRTAWWEFPRKNGKSTTASGIGLYLTAADGEAGGEVVAAAGKKDQAGFVFEPAKQMVLRSDGLRQRLKVYRNAIHYPATGTIFRVLASEGNLEFGLNLSGGIIDEVHVHKNRTLIDTLETSTGSREQPLIIFITTADEGDEGTIYAEKRSYAEKVAAGIVRDPSFYAVVFAAASEDDFGDEKTWGRANPGLGVTVRRDYLREQYVKAQESPALMARFLRLNLGIRVSQAQPAVTLEAWDASAGLVVPEQLKGRTAYAGIHVASAQDVTSFVLVFRDEEPDERGEYGYDVLPFFFLPRELAAGMEAQDRMPYRQWAKEGRLVLTEGDYTDYSFIQQSLEREAERYTISEIAYSRLTSPKFALDLGDAGLEMVPVSPTVAQLSPATKEMIRLVLAKKLRHSGHPVLRTQARSMVVKTNMDGDMRPDPSKSKGNIAGVMALVLGLDRSMRNEEMGSLISVVRPR